MWQFMTIGLSALRKMFHILEVVVWLLPGLWVDFFLLNPLHLNKPRNTSDKFSGHETTLRESGHILKNVGLSSINYLECFYLCFLVTNCNFE